MYIQVRLTHEIRSDWGKLINSSSLQSLRSLTNDFLSPLPNAGTDQWGKVPAAVWYSFDVIVHGLHAIPCPDSLWLLIMVYRYKPRSHSLLIGYIQQYEQQWYETKWPYLEGCTPNCDRNNPPAWSHEPGVWCPVKAIELLQTICEMRV